MRKLFPFRCIIFFLFGVAALSSCKFSTRPVSLWINSAPYSADPLDYDAASHHIAFTSVYIWLVSHYRVGEYTGELAERWQVSSDFKEWKFFLRKDMTFENGEIILPSHVADSWNRLARILKKRGSEAGFFEKLIGYRELLAPSRKIPGIIYDDSSITLRFSEPMPKLLDTIAFGLFAVVHPSCYDPVTDRWLDPKKTIASGAYAVREWTDNKLILELRKDYPATLRHSKPLRHINVCWGKNERYTSDIVDGVSRDDLSSKGFTYYGGSESGIEFLRCQSWALQSSPLSNLTARRQFRDYLYEELEKMSFRPDRSFFPLAIKGVHAMQPMPSTATLTAHMPPMARLKYRPFGIGHSYMDPIRTAFEKAAARMGITLEPVETPFKIMMDELNPNLPIYKNDIVSFGTDISIDDPDEDIRFMFKSKEGIRLPDPTRKAMRAISQRHIDIQQVNEILWNDAITWPLLHFSYGLWAKPDLDFSMLNLTLPPTALHLIGLKS